MVTTYGRRSGPPPLLIISIAIAVVVTCMLLWLLSLNLAEEQMSQQTITPSLTESRFNQIEDFPTFDLLPSPTPVPVCKYFEVYSETALIRDCPSTLCDIRERLRYEDVVCVYGKAQGTDNYPTAGEWHIIDLNPQGAFRDIAYMHQSLLRPLNPTPRPSATNTPLPTVTLTPTFTRPPTQVPPSITPTPDDPQDTPTPSPTPTPTDPPQRIEF